MGTIRVRDVQTRRCLDLSPHDPILRVPWEVSNVRGPCIVGEGLVTYTDTMGEHTARTRAGQLGECHPGELVLVQYEESTRVDERVWWLCEVQKVDGDDVGA